jgi:hypothetical protein
VVKLAGVDLARARYLVSPAGVAALGSLDPSLAVLAPTQLADRLRRQFPSFEAAALAEQLVLRARAAERFGHHRGFLYTAPGLEMMTHPAVSDRRAARLASLGLPIADLTVGLGGDLRACIDRGVPAAGVELDGVMAALAAANTAGRVVRGDALRAPVDLSRVAVILDPARRSESRRRFDPAAFTPPFDAALALAAEARAGVVKAPPGIDHAALPQDAEVEFVQLGRSLREAAVWMGEGGAPGLRRAVLLSAAATLASDGPEAPADVVPPASFLFDPEPCVTRAGLVRHLAANLRARLMDPQVAYLTASEPAFHPMAATFEVLALLPFSVSRLRTHLRRLDATADEIRKRAFPVEPDELRRLLGRTGSRRIALVCTTLGGKRQVFLCWRLFPESNCEEV